MGKDTKGHQGTAIPQCWMSPTSHAARDRHHGLPQDIGTCPSHGKLMVLLPGWGWPRQLWGGHRSILLVLGSCQSPQGTEHPEGAKLEPPDPGGASAGPSVPCLVPLPRAGGWRDVPRLAGALLS